MVIIKIHFLRVFMAINMIILYSWNKQRIIYYLKDFDPWGWIFNKSK